VIRLHDTRHTAATRMLDSGTTVSATAKWLGHDPAMTLRVYGHVYEDALASAGDVLLGGISPANEESTAFSAGRPCLSTMRTTHFT
jgi:DeoR/GlpR family transcriptional regulator of sugar metabolism